jgi:cytochrome P450
MVANRILYVSHLLTLFKLPIRELHYNTEIWGANIENLEPSRFVDNPKLFKSLSYRPWGGGHTLCPGRFLAIRIANGFLAALLTRYNVAMVSSAFPRGDGGRPSPGITTLDRDADLKLRLTPRV